MRYLILAVVLLATACLPPDRLVPVCKDMLAGARTSTDTTLVFVHSSECGALYREGKLR